VAIPEKAQKKETDLLSLIVRSPSKLAKNQKKQALREEEQKK